MKTDPPLNGEFMSDGSPLFDWEVQSIENRQAWGAEAAESAGEAKALEEAPLHRTDGPTPIELVLQKLTGKL